MGLGPIIEAAKTIQTPNAMMVAPVISRDITALQQCACASTPQVFCSSENRHASPTGHTCTKKPLSAGAERGKFEEINYEAPVA
jgi:hypothetical protein